MHDRIAHGLLIAALLTSGCGSSSSSDKASDEPATVAGSESAAVETPPPDQGREEPPQQDPEPMVESATIVEGTTATVEPTVDAGTPTEPAQPAAATSNVTLVDMPWEGVVEQIAAHKGKVVVVDLWATYCVPCRTSFPGLVELSKRDPDNIVCISVSLDDAGDPEKRAKALKFLEEQQAEFTNVLCTTDGDKLYDEILQIGGIPAVYVYGRDGAQAKLFTGPSPEGEDHTYEQHITPYVVELAGAQ